MTGFALPPGERLLWSGRPVRRRMVKPFAGAQVGIGLALSLVGTGAIVLGLSTHGVPAWMMAAAGVVLLTMGLRALFGRLVTREIRLRTTRYAVTDRRVLERALRVDRQEPLAELEPAELRPNGDGTGTIVFGEMPELNGLLSVHLLEPVGKFPGLIALIDVVDAERVHGLLLAAAEEARAAPE